MSDCEHTRSLDGRCIDCGNTIHAWQTFRKFPPLPDDGPQMSPEMKKSVLKVIDDLLAMPPEELKKLLNEHPYDPNSLGAMVVRAKYGMNESEKEPRTTWLPTQNIRAFSDPTEPNLHPHLFTAFVPKNCFDVLKRSKKFWFDEFQRVTKQLTMQSEAWKNKRIKYLKRLVRVRRELNEMRKLKDKAADVAIALGLEYNERVKELKAARVEIEILKGETCSNKS